jgi:hypothetical protein
MRVWIQVLVLLMMVLAVANAQCLARCGTDLCDSARPASHCHEDPDSVPTESCAHPHFALPSAAATAHVTLETAEMVVLRALTVNIVNPAEHPVAVSGDPPDIACPRLSVLRI